MNSRSSKQLLAVDIDDVLSRSVETIIAYSNRRWGYAHTLEDFNEHLDDMWQVDHKEAEERWVEYMSSGEMERYEVISDAYNALSYLHERYQIVAVTSRREELLPLTTQWLTSNYPNIVDKVLSANIYDKGHADAHKRTKATVLQKLGANYLIDDQPKHCNGAVEVGVQAVLFGEYPWNREAALASGVIRCKDWAAVREYFDELAR